MNSAGFSSAVDFLEVMDAARVRMEPIRREAYLRGLPLSEPQLLLRRVERKGWSYRVVPDGAETLVNLYLSGNLAGGRWVEAGLEMFGSAGRFVIHPCIDLENVSSEGSTTIWEGSTAEAVDLESLRLAAFDRIDELLATLSGMDFKKLPDQHR